MIAYKQFFKNYFSLFNKILANTDSCKLEKLSNLIISANKKKKKVIIVGNGGSASIASHITIDFINAAKIRAVNFNDPSIITCFSNDYGYENWVSKALECYANFGDVLILISSSGQSENMLIAASKAKSMNVDVITLTGFSSDNHLRQLGDINLWVDNNSYNMIEMTHNIWLLSVIDYIIEKNKGV